MQWTNIGIILNARRHGENSHIVTIFTQTQGRYAGLFKTSSKTKAYLQPGNFVQAKWSARLADHLGLWQLELLESPASRILVDRLKLTALGASLSLTEQLLAERHHYQDLYTSLKRFIDFLISGSNSDWYRAYIDYEIRLLDDLGFGLDFTKCAATGTTECLIYLSPRTGRAVSLEAGKPYADKLFRIPSFWMKEEAVTQIDFCQSLNITSYFLQKNLLEKGLPNARVSLEELIKKQLGNLEKKREGAPS